MSGHGTLQPSLPSSAYTDTAQYQLEKSRLFQREWIAICRAEDIAGGGEWRVFDVVGDDVLVVRAQDGVLRAFYNVCRHRGARLCAGPDEPAKPGRAVLPEAVLANGLIRCPYHAWTYRADGTLMAAPHISGSDGFDPAAFSLYPVGCTQWAGFVFLHLSPQEASPLQAQLGAAPARIQNYPLEALSVGHRLHYVVEANWKILCENYNECYHCGPMHPELCALVPAFRNQGGAALDWERGIPHRESATTFTWSGTTSRAVLPGLNEDERTRHKGELIYPNLFLSLAADHVTAYILRPRGPACTEVDCLFLFDKDELEKPGFDHSDASSFWHVVNQQDWAICERVQHGMNARPHRQGFYAPMEDANLDMRAYIESHLRQAT